MEELVFKFLDKKDIDDIYELTSEVYEGIENKEIFSHDSKEDLEALIDGGGSFIGVFDGDKLVVAKQNTAQNGEIVVALVDDSATVKTFYKEDGHYRLQPQNSSMEPIIVDNVEIIGKVISLFRPKIVS